MQLNNLIKLTNTSNVFVLRENVMHLLRKGHGRDIRGNNLVGLGWHLGKVPVRVIHERSRLLDDLDDGWLNGKLDNLLFVFLGRFCRAHSRGGHVADCGATFLVASCCHVRIRARSA